MTDDEIRTSIAKAKGIEKIGWVHPNGTFVPGYLYWLTDIKAAWELVDEMESQDIRLIIFTGVNDIHGYKKGEDDTILFEIYGAPTIKHAICLAWLAWKEKQLEG